MIYSCFNKAGGRIDVVRRIDIYRQFDFAYPCHLTLGFLATGYCVGSLGFVLESQDFGYPENTA